MSKIEIKSSKTKLFLLLLGVLIFLFLGLFLAFKPSKFVSTIFRSEIFICLAGILAILFAVFCLSVLIKSFFTKTSNLIIDETGINDNSSFSSVGMILWEDIVSVKTITVVSTKFLLIEVKNPDKYIYILIINLRIGF
ncbi:MAG: STM3941 family protein [Chryseobacterium jejuense]|uniref:STM3941 family protein n=1 Tax=Chryseobacterium jejuense TaxID=445960 RepID=UPI003D0A5C73